MSKSRLTTVAKKISKRLKKNPSEKTPKKNQHKIELGATLKSIAKKMLKWGALGLLIVGILVGLGFFFLSRQPEGFFLRHITVAGLSAPQAKTQTEWMEQIQRLGEERLNQEFTFAQPEGSSTKEAAQGIAAPITEVKSSLKQLGLSVNWMQWKQETTQRLETLSLLDKAWLVLAGWNVSPAVELDPSLSRVEIKKVQEEQPLQEASFEWTAAQATAKVKPEQTGYAFPTDFSWILGVWAKSELPETVEIPFEVTLPRWRAVQLEPLLPLATEFGRGKVEFTTDDGQTWTWPLSEKLNLLVPEPTPWTLDETLTQAAFTETFGALEQEPQGVVITQDEAKKIHFEGSARFGKKLDREALYQSLLTALRGEEGELLKPTEAIKVPILETKPEVQVPEELKAQGIVELVGLGYSDFKGSPVNRVHNIQTGIAQFNGVIIPQGAEFSFMQHLSPVDAANGFLPELVIKGDETIPEYGGGLCQISSTLFRAALYSGLPITARRNHSYAVAYYARPFGYGLDATVYDPAPDFRFINDTPASLLIQAYTEGTSAYYVLYGTHDQRTVSMEGPFVYGHSSIAEPVVTLTDKLEPGVREVKEHGHTGFKVDWYRTVIYPEGSLSSYAATASGVRENIHSDYEARPQKVWEGQAASITDDASNSGQ